MGNRNKPDPFIAPLSPPLSKTRKVGSTLYLSGELGFGPDGKIPAGIEAQTRNCLTNIRNTLDAEGYSMADVVSAACYLTDKSDFAAFNTVYAEFFGDPLPTRTTVIADLVIEAAIEITVVAAK